MTSTRARSSSLGAVAMTEIRSLFESPGTSYEARCRAEALRTRHWPKSHRRQQSAGCVGQKQKQKQEHEQREVTSTPCPRGWSVRARGERALRHVDLAFAEDHRAGWGR